MPNPLKILSVFALLLVLFAPSIQAEEANSFGYSIFNEKLLLQRGHDQYIDYPKTQLLEMIKDEDLPSSYQRAAAIRVFKEKFANEVVSNEKKGVEKILVRRLNDADSPFVEIELMHALCIIDRYQYFKNMIPALIQKLDHYNPTINEFAFQYINQIIDAGNNRAREARIVFSTLRKILFLSRKRLARTIIADERLEQKLKILRWSIKVLGNQELKKLPKEVINLL